MPARTRRRRRASQRQSDENVEGADERDRQQKEKERRRLEDVARLRQPLGRDVADERVRYRRAGRRIADVVVGPRQRRVRQRRGAGDHPDDEYRLHGARQRRDGLRPQRVADGDVAFDGEGGDREDRRRRGHLGEEGLEEAVRLAEAPGIRLPDRVQLRR